MIGVPSIEIEREGKESLSMNDLVDHANPHR